MRKDRVLGWTLSAALHGLLLLGAGLTVVRTSGGTATGDTSEASYSLSLREGPSGAWTPQFYICEFVVPPFKAAESGLLPTPQVPPKDQDSRRISCDEELHVGLPCPVCSTKRARITDAALKEAGKRRPGLRRYGAARVDWWPEDRCGLDLVDKD
jgi:hypothetical protein